MSKDSNETDIFQLNFKGQTPVTCLNQTVNTAEIHAGKKTLSIKMGTVQYRLVYKNNLYLKKIKHEFSAPINEIADIERRRLRAESEEKINFEKQNV